MRLSRITDIAKIRKTVLHINLTEERSSRIELSEEEVRTYSGGRLLALMLWDRYVDYENLNPERYEHSNPIIFAPGPVSELETATLSSMSIVTRNPATGRIAVGVSTSSFAQAILGCDLVAIVITGRLRRFGGVAIEEGEVNFHSAEEYYGQVVSQVQQRVKIPHLALIGPAGERYSPYGSIIVDGQSVGPAGIGSVMGMKNLKYIGLSPHAMGRESADAKKLAQVMKYYLRRGRNSQVGARVSDHGDMATLQRANTHGWAAIDGFSTRVDGRLWDLIPSEEQHASSLSLLYALALGPNIGLFGRSGIERLYKRCVDNGLDPVGVGVLLVWATATRREGTLGFLPDLRRPSPTLYERLLDGIAYQKGAASELAKPLEQLVELYGGAEHAYLSGAMHLLPLDLRALPIHALLASLGDETIVWGELIWGSRYRRTGERRLARWALSARWVSYAAQSVGVGHPSLIRFECTRLRRFPYKSPTKQIYHLLADLSTLCSGKVVPWREVLGWGKKAHALQQQIDYKLNGETPLFNPLPQRLLVDGRSNHPTAHVVSLARLQDAYRSLIEREKQIESFLSR
jgi:aldehyde:ferredoxin oxidoreductase